MNETEKTRGHDKPNGSTESGKKKYVKPAFIREKAFETMALSCGKVNISQAQCKLNRKNS